jgi:3-mercaptopyruvate sulfurtransferase SseA
MSKKNLKLSSKIFLLLAFALVATLTFWGCSSDSYDEPDTTTQNAPLAGQTQNVLIDAATLKGWVDAGLVNNSESYEKVAILCFGGTYDEGHIPGAQLWATGGIERYEGPVLSSNMALDGETMDALLQAAGIDENTTVVFAGSEKPARLYFNFRYWGFPKERLKILNGNQKAWINAGYELTTVVPTVTPSNFSVKNLSAFNPDVRASLDELIKAAEGQTAFILNALTDNTEMAGKTTGIFAPHAYDKTDTTYEYTEYTESSALTAAGACIKEGKPGYDPNCDNDYVIFQGSIVGANHVGNAAFYNADDGTIKTAADVQTLLESYGIDSSKPIVTYCRAGNAASNAFMPIDVTLGWPVMVYDGSWSQWGSLTNQTGLDYVPDASYALPEALSEWATDGLIEWHTLTKGDFAIPAKQIPGPYYNVKLPKVIEKPTFQILDSVLTPDSAGANSIEIEDREYYETPATGGVSGPVGGGAGGGC